MDVQPALPIDDSWHDTDEYVESLLNFVSTSTLFQNLCGGVHILDFLTRNPGLYDTILPLEWREWFSDVSLEDILDFILRQDLDYFDDGHGELRWQGHDFPPPSLVEYVRNVRLHSLRREVQRISDIETLPRHLAVGMKPKKIHEVTKFAAFVNDLSTALDKDFAHDHPDSMMNGENEKGTVIIDFGSGQNYLGRTLTCPPYDKHVIAIEQQQHNVAGAKAMDIHAKIADKEKKMINKKEWKRQLTEKKEQQGVVDLSIHDPPTHRKDVPDIDWNTLQRILPPTTTGQKDAMNFMQSVQADLQVDQLMADPDNHAASEDSPIPATPMVTDEHLTPFDSIPISNKIRYVEKELSNGSLDDIVSSTDQAMVVSIHSCGNLTHHGLRSIKLNPAVKAVAMIGCCYNLMTERLGPPTYKLPTLRSNHPRLKETSNAFDSHGFPMSKRLEDHPYLVHGLELPVVAKGIRLNITARMMAVQAPHNWGPKDSEEFFTKHYYRALLQRILLDLGVVKMSSPECVSDIEYAGASLSGKNDTGAPLIIGTLRKSCFKSFPAYVRGAVEKLSQDPVDGDEIRQKTLPLFESDDQLIRDYEKSYHYAKKELSVIWSLMAFSANVVESTIIVDRWLWLMEQQEVEDAWVEAVFDYKQSPRNMVVVGIKKQDP